MRKGVKVLFCLIFSLIFGFFSNSFAEENVLKIGVLIDLSASLATFGHQIEQGLNLAKPDIENYLKSQGLPYKIQFFVEDTQTNPFVCIKKLQVLKAKGINVVIGPISSGELKNVRHYVTSNKMVIFSYSTAIPYMIGFTSPEQKKYIFRIVPNDGFQGKVIAQVLKNLGVKNLLVVYREDPWGKGLEEAVKHNLKGIRILDEISYPATPEPSDWSPYIERMTGLLKGKSPRDTAVLAIGFEELATLLSQIKEDSPLLSYKWFGSDGIVDSSKVLEEAKDKAVKIKFYSTIFYSRGPSVKMLKARYGREVPQYVLNSYDALWIATIPYAEVLKETGSFNADFYVKKVKEDVKKYSLGNYGITPVTGKIEFNKWNDRARGNYGIHIVTSDGWKLAGIWDCETGKISWLRR